MMMIPDQASVKGRREGATTHDEIEHSGRNAEGESQGESCESGIASGLY